jgi:hypothetical protein
MSKQITGLGNIVVQLSAGSDVRDVSPTKLPLKSVPLVIQSVISLERKQANRAIGVEM